ncbi:hypothetical protein CVT91_03650, partial [Candidatus Atribacteria bacterium HGW-Atribacteria-1]
MTRVSLSTLIVDPGSLDRTFAADSTNTTYNL